MSNNLDSTQMSENSKKTDNTQLSDTLEKTDDSDVSDDSNVSNLSSLSDNSLSSISTNSTQSDEDDEEDDDEDDEDEDEEDDDDEDDEDEDDEDEDEDDEDEEDEEDEEDKDKEDEDEFEDLSTESISSITSSCIKEEMKIYNKRIAALENKMDVNNTMLKQIDSKLNKLLNSKQLINNKKRKPLNDLNNLTRAPQIDEENNENNDENDINISSDQKDKNNKKRKIMRIYKNQIIVSEVDQMTYEKMLAENEKNNKINSLAYTSQIDDNSSNQPILNNILNNKWSNKILEKWGCCINNCINSTQRGFCQKGNGIVRINDNLAKYYITTIKNGINRSIKLITEKGFSPSTEFASLYYFEVKIIPEILEKSGWSSEIGLFCKNNSEQKSKYYCVCSNGLYYSNEVVKTSTMYKQMFGCLIKSNDIVGCGIYFPKLNQNNNQNFYVAQLFFTLNGEKRGKTISLEITNSENASSLFYPNVSLFCCSVEANFDGSTNKFLYNIDEFKIEE